MFRSGQTQHDDNATRGTLRLRPVGNIHPDIFSSSNPRHPPPTSPKRLSTLVFGNQRIAGIGILLAILFGMGGCICLIASGIRSDSPKPILLASDHLNGKEGKFEVWLISQEAYSHAKRTFTQDYVDYLLEIGVAPEKTDRSYLGKPLNIPIFSMGDIGNFGKVWTRGPWTIRVQDVVHSDSRCAHLEVMIKGYESHPFILEIIKDMDGPSANIFCLEVRRPEGNLYGTIEANIFPADPAINLRLEW